MFVTASSLLSAHELNLVVVVVGAVVAGVGAVVLQEEALVVSLDILTGVT